MQIKIKKDSVLDIFVENQGRLSNGPTTNDHKVCYQTHQFKLISLLLGDLGRCSS